MGITGVGAVVVVAVHVAVELIVDVNMVVLAVVDEEIADRDNLAIGREPDFELDVER